MSVSPKLIGKTIGGIVGLGICALAFLWFRSTYSIQGTIQVDTGIEIRQARQIDVNLIQGFVTDDLDQLVAEYNSFRKEQLEVVFERLMEKSRGKFGTENPEEKTIVNVEEKIEYPEADSDKAENDTIRKRIREYAENAIYCREKIPEIPEGKEFYEAGALFWEEKISNLKDFDRVIVDEASLNYETTWKPSGGLGEEPIQIVKAIIRTNVINLANVSIEPVKENVEEAEKTVETEKSKVNEVVPGSLLTKEEVMDFAVELNRALNTEQKVIAGKSRDLILAMTMDQTKTDNKGSFVFKNKSVQPGNYILSSKFDILSIEGIPVEFTWFNPVKISINRFAFDKTTLVNLDEVNQSKPPYMDIYIPEKEELYLELVDMLNLEFKKPEIEVDESENIIDELLLNE